MSQTDAILAQAAVAEAAPIKPLSLRRNFSWTLAGNICYAGCQWGMLVVLAKLGSPEMVGRFALGLAVSAPVVMLANLQLRAVQATDARREYAFGHYLALRLVGAPAALLVILAVALISGYARETLLVVGAVAVAKAFESVSDVFYGLLQQRERMDRIALSMMVKGPLSLAAMGLAVWATGDVFWGVVAIAGAWLAVLVFFDLPSAVLVAGPGERLRPAFEPARLARLAWLAAPLGVVMMLISLNANIPRYFIKAHLGERELGIFAAMAYMLVAGHVVTSALSQAVAPRLAVHAAAGQMRSFSALTLRLIALGAATGVLIILLAALGGERILALMYTPEYSGRADVLLVLCLAAALGFAGAGFDASATALRYMRTQAVMHAVRFIMILVACVLLIPRYGLLGAAWSLVIGRLASLVTYSLLALWLSPGSAR